MNVDLSQLFQTIGLDVALAQEHEALFREAFTHRSIDADYSNERLEFLGDAVLELVTTEHLYQDFPDKPEGELTNYRSALVKRENLALVARKLHLGDLLLMSKGEEASGGRSKDYLLANVVESLVGALYLTVGLDQTRDFIEVWVLSELEGILEQDAHIDPKSALQELTQGDFGVTPRYETVGELGLDHEKTFEVAVFLDDLEVGKGKGSSKKEAQAKAAEQALKKDAWKKKLK